MIFLTFIAVDLGEKINYEERFALYCPYTGNNLLEMGWQYPSELLYINKNSKFGNAEFISEELKEIYQRFSEGFKEKDFDHSNFLDYLVDQESENTLMMKWDIVHPVEGIFGDFVSVVYRNDGSY
jgi:hypothetical protein